MTLLTILRRRLCAVGIQRAGPSFATTAVRCHGQATPCLGNAQWTNRVTGFRSPSVRNSPVMFSTTTTTTTSTTAEEEEKRKKFLKSNASKQQQKPRIVFPWVHDDKIPDQFFFINGVIVFQQDFGTMSGFIAWLFCGYPWYEVLFSSKWKEELADNFSWAFSQGVAGIISNVYKVPFDSISKEETVHVTFDYNFEADGKLKTKDDIQKEAPATSATDDDNKTKIDNNETDDKNNDNNNYCPEVEYMLEKNLRDLYSSAHENGKGNMQINLQMKPIRAELMALYGLPFVSRPAITEKVSRLDDYMQIMGILRSQGLSVFVQHFRNYADQIFNERKVLETTVVALVCIHCEEQFSVVDPTSGITIQGNEDHNQVRNVVHMVQFERNAALQSNDLETTGMFDLYDNYTSDWQITDIDSLLKGNPWNNYFKNNNKSSTNDEKS